MIPPIFLNRTAFATPEFRDDRATESADFLDVMDETAPKPASKANAKPWDVPQDETIENAMPVPDLAGASQPTLQSAHISPATRTKPDAASATPWFNKHHDAPVDPSPKPADYAPLALENHTIASSEIAGEPRATLPGHGTSPHQKNSVYTYEVKQLSRTLPLLPELMTESPSQDTAASFPQSEMGKSGSLAMNTNVGTIASAPLDGSATRARSGGEGFPGDPAPSPQNIERSADLGIARTEGTGPDTSETAQGLQLQAGDEPGNNVITAGQAEPSTPPTAEDQDPSATAWPYPSSQGYGRVSSTGSAHSAQMSYQVTPPPVQKTEPVSPNALAAPYDRASPHSLTADLPQPGVRVAIHVSTFAGDGQFRDANTDAGGPGSPYAVNITPGIVETVTLSPAFSIDPLASEPVSSAGSSPQAAISAPDPAANRTSPPPHFLGPEILRLMQLSPEGPVTVTLTPADLGTMRFEVTQTERGMHIHLLVDQPQTLELLRKQADQVLADLRQSGFAGTSLSFAGGGGQDASRQQGAPTDGARPLADGSRPNTPFPLQPHPILPSGTLDLRL